MPDLPVSFVHGGSDPGACGLYLGDRLAVSQRRLTELGWSVWRLCGATEATLRRLVQRYS